jgi:hypothetical protein
MWLCNSIAFPVDISYDAFNVDFKTIVQGKKGYFVQVKPGTHTDGSYPVVNNIVGTNPAKGVLNVVGKPAGVYEYIFVSTSADGFCGMNEGQQSVVRIYLVPQLTGFPVLTNICPGKTENINFNDFIPPEIQYFINTVGWEITYTLNGTKVDMPIKAGLSNMEDNLSKVGDNVYRYTINDAAGKHINKYKELQGSPYFCPEDSANLTHTVRIREDEEYVIPNKSISFCTEVLQLVPETSTSLNVNLFGYLGSSAPGGEWSIEYKGDLYVDEENDPIIKDKYKGDVSIPIDIVSNLEDFDKIIFKYSYKDCKGKDISTLLTFVFNGEAFAKTFVEHEREICRNLMGGVVELSSIFGFTAPLTSGVWFRQDTVGEYEEMLYGAVDISEMQSGSRYTFRYNISEAVDAMCGLVGDSTLFHVRLHDLEVANAETRICKKQFAEGVTIDLSRYVPGLNDTNRISPKKITWRDTSNNEISKNHYLKSEFEWQTADTSTYRMKFQYEVESDCGPYTGNLYISAVDSIGIDTLRKVIICYTDDYAKHVDLFQLLGVVGAKGYFTLCDTDNDLPPDVLEYIEEYGIMNAYNLYDDAHESEAYTFCYVRGADDLCVPTNMQIEIIVTRDVAKKSEFK